MKNELIEWNAAGCRVVLLPSHGRVLQVEVGGDAAYWNNPKWDGEEWNAGGDRLWVGPEQAWFWKSTDSIDVDFWEIQDSMDPGSWKVEVSDEGHCRLRQSVDLEHRHGAGNISIDVTRDFELLPLAPEGFSSSICYRNENTLSVKSPSGSSVLISVWPLIQLPNGGELFISTSSDPIYHDYYEPLTEPHKKEVEGLLALRITGDQRYKVGIPASATTGRMAYVRAVGDDALVIYRQFFPQPWLAYCDYPQGLDANTAGDALQAYNDSGAHGGFGEMEYHTPAIDAVDTGASITDSNITIVGLVPLGVLDGWKQDWLVEGSGWQGSTA